MPPCMPDAPMGVSCVATANGLGQLTGKLINRATDLARDGTGCARVSEVNERSIRKSRLSGTGFAARTPRGAGTDP